MNTDVTRHRQNTLVRVGKRGTLVIPAHLRAELRIEEGQILEISVSERGLLFEPVSDSPIERFRRAFGPFFEGVDPVEFQRELRAESPRFRLAGFSWTRTAWSTSWKRPAAPNTSTW